MVIFFKKFDKQRICIMKFIIPLLLDKIGLKNGAVYSHFSKINKTHVL